MSSLPISSRSTSGTSTEAAPLLLGDLPEKEFRDAIHQVAEWILDYRGRIEERPISSATLPGEVSARLPPDIPELGAPIESILRDFQQLILPHLVHWGHPAFLGYFGSTTTAPGILGEMIAAALNVSAMTWRTSPAATELETVVLEWLRRMLHLPDIFSGVVYDTASVATLHALAAARESLNYNIRTHGLSDRPEIPRLRIYASDQAHSSIVKAAVTLGVGEMNVQRIPCDNLFRMDVRQLRESVESDRRAGYLPLAVIATVGTTSSAAVDPVPQIASFCREQNIWLHIDAAYGGALALLPEGRHLMDGVEAADSVVVNPHKWLFVPLDFSTLYITRPELLRAVFSLVPEYLRGDAEQGEINFMDYGIQLGRRFRALKAWMVFSAFGERGLVARIREHIRLAKVFAGWIDADPTFELLAPVTMGVVCFRATGTAGGDITNELNRSIVKAVNATGRAYITHTMLGQNVAMRVAIGNVLTLEQHLADVYRLIGRELMLVRNKICSPDMREGEHAPLRRAPGSN